MWYQRIIKTSTPELVLASAITRDIVLPASRPRMLRSSDNEGLDDHPAQFRRVRLRYRHEDFGVQQPLDYEPVLCGARPPTLISQQPRYLKTQQIAAAFDLQSF